MYIAEERMGMGDSTEGECMKYVLMLVLLCAGCAKELVVPLPRWYSVSYMAHDSGATIYGRTPVLSRLDLLEGPRTRQVQRGLRRRYEYTNLAVFGITKHTKIK